MDATEITRELETLRTHGRARGSAEVRGDAWAAEQHKQAADETAERLVRLVTRRDDETQ